MPTQSNKMCVGHAGAPGASVSAPICYPVSLVEQSSEGGIKICPFPNEESRGSGNTRKESKPTTREVQDSELTASTRLRCLGNWRQDKNHAEWA